jgi:hypothetical protein
MKKLLFFILFVTITVTIFSQTTYTVNSTDDLPDANINDNVCADANGNCTLRAAIENANKASNKDIIAFNISGTAPFTIAIQTSELPAIGYPIVIDGRTQPEYATSNSPVIEIDGSSLPIDNSGLRLYSLSDNSEIYGLSIGGFQRSAVPPYYTGGYGIDVRTQNTIVQSNYLGLKPDGSTVNRNVWGVFFLNSGNNTVGGTGANQGNVVSGNYIGGVTFQGEACSNNVVQGNLLGTDATGLLARGNKFNLQFIDAPNNLVGGNTPAARNIISAGVNVRFGENEDEVEDGTGMSISGVNSTNITIIGNYIGTDITGTSALSNVRGGILILNGANNITIGGEGAGEANVISGNGFKSSGETFFGGIYLQTNADSNIIKGNYIGVDVTGNVAMPNARGIYIRLESNDNIIGGTTPNSKNIISGNTLDGITISSAENNQIIGNYVGLNATGTVAIPNDYGIYIEGSNNSIGGNEPGTRNIISGNSVGVLLSSSSSTGCSIKGNYIGLNALGNAALPNDTGVFLNPSATNIIIGGPDISDRNIISGNFDKGIVVSGTSHTVQNNYIGLNPAGDGVIKNNNYGLQFNGVVTSTMVSENVISGNGTVSSTGRNVYFGFADGASFFSNIVGTLPDGITGVSNPGPGIVMFNSNNNIIGGDSEVKGNIIAGNSSRGINLVLACINNIIDNNKIGVGSDGTTIIGNGISGIEIGGDIVGGTISNNIIANSSRGVYLNPSSGIATQIRISQNSIYNNSILGIDLGGTTVNDVDDPDTGVNNLQNTPEVSSINYLGGEAIEITYAVPSSITNSAYPLLIEFFGASAGQGKFFIDSDSYTVPGPKTVTINLPVGYDEADYNNIVGTATDANGNTSEFGVNVSYTLSVTQFENEINSFKLYPNPVSDRLFLQSPVSESFSLQIINTLGQEVFSKKNNVSSVELDVSTLSKGLYFLNITSENGTAKTIKFIKK